MSLRAALLGFLSLEPASGYTLRQRFEGSVGSFWTVTQSQIYRELHALERDGKARARREASEGKPDRKVYELTPAGEEELCSWLREPLEPMQLRHPLLLKFVFAAEVEPQEFDRLLAKYEAGLEATRAEYAARAASKEIFALARSPREGLLWRLSIEHGLAWVETELGWVKRSRRALLDSAATKAKAKRNTE